MNTNNQIPFFTNHNTDDGDGGGAGEGGSMDHHIYSRPKPARSSGSVPHRQQPTLPNHRASYLLSLIGS